VDYFYSPAEHRSRSPCGLFLFRRSYNAVIEHGFEPTLEH
jgi:hypothetical protein